MKTVPLVYTLQNELKRSPFLKFGDKNQIGTQQDCNAPKQQYDQKAGPSMAEFFANVTLHFAIGLFFGHESSG